MPGRVSCAKASDVSVIAANDTAPAVTAKLIPARSGRRSPNPNCISPNPCPQAKNDVGWLAVARSREREERLAGWHFCLTPTLVRNAEPKFL
jgi:hypothetical protein